MPRKKKIFYCFYCYEENKKPKELCFETKEKAEESRQMYINNGIMISEICQKKKIVYDSIKAEFLAEKTQELEELLWESIEKRHTSKK